MGESDYSLNEIEPSIYLAGPVKEAYDNGRGWRGEVKEKFDWADWIDPLEKYDVGDECDPEITDEEIVASDLEMIDSSDMVFVNFEESVETMGTPMEVLYASQNDVPVVVCWQPETVVSPWLQTYSDYVTGIPMDAAMWMQAHFDEDEDREDFTPLDVEFMNPSDDEEDDREESEMYESGDAKAQALLQDVGNLVNDSRDTHGDAVENQEHIASGWTWYLKGKDLIDSDKEITGGDVGRMMGLLKMSRTSVGDYDIDHDRDVAGYAGIAAACEVSRGISEEDELTIMDSGGH